MALTNLLLDTEPLSEELPQLVPHVISQDASLPTALTTRWTENQRAPAGAAGRESHGGSVAVRAPSISAGSGIEAVAFQLVQ